ncbi:MAG: M20/M25/M40 family metallo-hydrolase [Verrucomicrobia bacterium]|nr:M20/M25/M40 family metallo-hydrolase [Verrucomicrobiota bacterium]
MNTLPPPLPRHDLPVSAIRTAVNRRADAILAWTKRFIRFASENRPPDGAEAAAQRWLAAQCRQQAWDVEVFSPLAVRGIRRHSSWLDGRHYPAGRKNVVARWRGHGGGRSLLLSGHADVAPSEPRHWNVCRPYQPVVRGGRLYGRGSADMKGGLAAMFWAIRILQELGFRPGGDLLFESVVDEEFAGGNGTLASRLRGHNAALAIVGEPTRMEVCPACLGAFLGNLTLTGRGGMAYMGKAIANPLHGAARALELFRKFEAQWRAQHRHRLFPAAGKPLHVLPWHITTETPGEFTQMGTPLLATLAWIVWCHPGTTENAFFRMFRAFWKAHGAQDPALRPFKVTVERTYHFVKPWETPVGSPAVRAVAQAFQHYAGHTPVIGGAPFSCDLGICGEAGRMPSILLGPRGDHLHAPDEWVEIEDILTLTGIYATLAVQWSGATGLPSASSLGNHRSRSAADASAVFRQRRTRAL